MHLSSISLALRQQFSGLAAYSPSLSLDLTSGNQTLDPRVTFSRTSNATVTGPDGVLGYAPHNLLTYSEQFDNAAWGKSGTTVTANGFTAPDGTTTADVLIEDTSLASTHTIQRAGGGAGLDKTTNSTYSIYVKAVNRTRFRLQINFYTGNSVFLNVNLADGSFTALAGGTGVYTNGGVIDVGNGWFRCFVTGFSTTVGSGFDVALLVLNNAGTTVFDGNGLPAFQLWGAQLNVGALQPYYPTTVDNLLGYTQEFDNAAWGKSNSFVQTNLLTYSEELNVYQAIDNATVSTNTVNAPNGTTTADGLTATLSGGANTCWVQKTTSIAANTAPYTASVFVKQGSSPTTAINLALFNGTYQEIFGTLTFSTKAFVLSGGMAGSATGAVQELPDGWYRISVSFSNNGTNTAAAVREYVSNPSGSTVGLFTYFWGIQLVQGAVAGDYVTTYGTARAVMYSAPDGSVTADKLVENTGSVAPFVTQAATVIAGTPYTLSAYGKEDTASAKRYLMLLLPSAQFGANIRITINLATGTYTTVGSPTAVSVTSVGNGWYRANVTANCTVAGSASGQVRMTNDANGSVTAYTGDGTSGIFIWGAQLSDSASLDPYVYNPVAAPTPAAYYGPRFDYDPVTLAPKGLLIEEQRTNLLTFSEQFDNAAWGKAALTITANVTAAPNGEVTVDKLVETTATAEHLIWFGRTGSNETVTFSIFAKQAERTRIRIGFSNFLNDGRGAIFDLAAGTVVFVDPNGTDYTNISASISTASNGFYRCSITSTKGAANTANNPFFETVVGTSFNYAGTAGSGIYIWGAQLEAGAFATSYIPTTTAAATRAADVATMIGANFSNWYNQNEGTLFADAVVPAYLFAFPTVATISDGSINNQTSHYLFTSGIYANVRSGGVVQGDPGRLTSPIVGSNYKFTVALGNNQGRAAANGVIGTLITPLTMPVNVNQMRIGANVAGGAVSNTHIRRLAFFPRRLSDVELQGITS